MLLLFLFLLLVVINLDVVVVVFGQGLRQILRVFSRSCLAAVGITQNNFACIQINTFLSKKVERKCLCQI